MEVKKNKSKKDFSKIRFGPGGGKLTKKRKKKTNKKKISLKLEKKPFNLSSVPQPPRFSNCFAVTPFKFPKKKSYPWDDEIEDINNGFDPTEEQLEKASDIMTYMLNEKRGDSMENFGESLDRNGEKIKLKLNRYRVHCYCPGTAPGEYTIFNTSIRISPSEYICVDYCIQAVERLDSIETIYTDDMDGPRFPKFLPGTEVIINLTGQKNNIWIVCGDPDKTSSGFSYDLLKKEKKLQPGQPRIFTSELENHLIPL